MIFGHQSDDTQTSGGTTVEPEVLESTPSSVSSDTSATNQPQGAAQTTNSTPSDSLPPTRMVEKDQASDAPPSRNDNNDLLTLKQEALQQLTPLVHQLDQTPEERFRTTMMMIQSTDNQNLIKNAYSAAQEIKDDKARAQALLDIINEINYFTQQKTT